MTNCECCHAEFRDSSSCPFCSYNPTKHVPLGKSLIHRGYTSKTKQVWEYKGKRYIVTCDDAAMKHPVDRSWINAVIYEAERDSDYPLVRERDDFIKKFKRVH